VVADLERAGFRQVRSRVAFEPAAGPPPGSSSGR
jgi:hypothetical protein